MPALDNLKGNARRLNADRGCRDAKLLRGLAGEFRPAVILVKPVELVVADAEIHDAPSRESV